MAYGVLANIHSLTGNVFSDTQVNAAIVTGDQMIDAEIGDRTIAAPSSVLKSLGDRIAARILMSGIKTQNAAAGKHGDYSLPELSKEEKRRINQIFDSEITSYASQDYA